MPAVNDCCSNVATDNMETVGSSECDPAAALHTARSYIIKERDARRISSSAKGGRCPLPARTVSSRHSAVAGRIGEERRGRPMALVQKSLHADRLTGGGARGPAAVDALRGP